MWSRTPQKGKGIMPLTQGWNTKPGRGNEGQVGKCVRGTRRLHDWECRDHNWHRTENTRRSCQLGTSSDSKKPSSMAAGCPKPKCTSFLVLGAKNSIGDATLKILNSAIEHEGVGVSRCTNMHWNQRVRVYRNMKTPRRCAVWIFCDQPISAPSNILYWIF